MKIVFLFPHFLSPGGAANVVLQFAKALQSNGHQVEICCAKVSEEFRINHSDLKFTELNIPASNSIAYWVFLPFWQLKIHHQLNGYNDCILFPHVLPSNWWAWIYKKRKNKVKVIWYCNEPSAFIHSRAWINAIPVQFMKWGAKMFNPFLKKIDIRLEKENDIVICNSNFTAGQYQKIYQKKADAVIYPPLHVKNRSLEKNKQDYILTVGRLSRFKNVDLLITAFRKLAMELFEIKLVIVGEGEDKSRLEQLSADLELENRISFKGKITDEELAEVYQQARVTVICSYNEPFGLVPIESMINGTPVIAHNSGGPQETVRHSITGYLYNDETELIRYIKEIFEADSNKYFQMQQNCLKDVQQYDVSCSIPKLESFFQKLINEKSTIN